MPNTRRSSIKSQTKRAIRGKLHGFASSDQNTTKSKKIVFDQTEGADKDVDSSLEVAFSKVDGVEIQALCGDSEDADTSTIFVEEEKKESDDTVEEIKGSVARESTVKLREVERASNQSKKKRARKTPTEKELSHVVNNEQEDESDNFLTEDFFKMVDSERAGALKSAELEKKEKIQSMSKTRKHTTFTIADEFTCNEISKEINQNIEVVALGGEPENQARNDYRTQNLISTTAGSAPSKSAVAFARGSLSAGVSMERHEHSGKRSGKNDTSWKRSRKVMFGSRPGCAAPFFSRKKVDLFQLNN